MEYVWDDFGRLMLMSDNNLPAGVSVELFPAGFGAGVGSVMAEIISDVEWTADKRLQSYVVTNYDATMVPSVRSRVVLTYGGPAMSTRPTSCFENAAFVDDHSGRLRRIRVETLTGGVPLYERTYTWMADQISSVDVCYRGQSAPLNLVNVPFGGVNQRKAILRNDATGLGAEAFNVSAHYDYDAQGSRTAEWSGSQPGGWLSTVERGSLVTAVTPTVPGNTRGDMHYRFDGDGRQVERTSAPGAQGQPSTRMKTRFPTSEMQASGGLDSVLRTVELEQLGETGTGTGLVYNYFYDGSNHRIRKTYPTGGADDFFYGQRNELLAERSFEYFDEGTGPRARYALDEYIYLGGMPVVSIVGALNRDNQIHLPDMQGTCTRRNVARPCSMYQVVPDIQGTPVVAFDPGMQVVGVGEYDLFGHRNRVKLLNAETAHPILGTGEVMLSGLSRAQAGSLSVSVRARASFLDGETRGGGLFFGSFVELKDASGALRGTAVGVYPNNWTPWVTGGAPYSIVFEPALARGTMGAVADAFEYDRTTAGIPETARYFPPLRFPGQYFDEESDLHENWNRYMDPTGGRYLSPEPMLQMPAYVSLVAMGGRAVPTYAYAFNNPLRYTDKNGLGPNCDRDQASCNRNAYYLRQRECQCKAIGGAFSLSVDARDALDLVGGKCNVNTASCGSTPATGFDSNLPTDLGTFARYRQMSCESVSGPFASGAPVPASPFARPPPPPILPQPTWMPPMNIPMSPVGVPQVGIYGMDWW